MPGMSHKFQLSAITVGLIAGALGVPMRASETEGRQGK